MYNDNRYAFLLQLNVNALSLYQYFNCTLVQIIGALRFKLDTDNLYSNW